MTESHGAFLADLSSPRGLVTEKPHGAVDLGNVRYKSHEPAATIHD